MRRCDGDRLDAAKISLGPLSVLVQVTYVKGSSVCCENIVRRMLLQISAFVSSVAVMSINTFRVFRLIFV